MWHCLLLHVSLPTPINWSPSLFSIYSGSTPVSSLLAYIINHSLNSLVVTFSLYNKYLTILLQQETLSFLLSVCKLLVIIFSLYNSNNISIPLPLNILIPFSCPRADSLNRNYCSTQNLLTLWWLPLALRNINLSYQSLNSWKASSWLLNKRINVYLEIYNKSQWRSDNMMKNWHNEYDNMRSGFNN